MAVILLSATTDPASQNLKQTLLKKAEWTPWSTFSSHPVYRHQDFSDVYLLTITDNKIFHEHIDVEIVDALDIQPELFIFLSRHRSKTGLRSLTVHPIGNYREAKFGGRNNTLVPCAPQVMTQLLRLLWHHHESSSLNWQVCFEVTHHGPFLETPTVFIEIGSTKQQWGLTKPAAVIVTTLLELFQSKYHEDDFIHGHPIVIGIGGGHYAPRFTDVALHKQVAFGHMIPTYQVDPDCFDLSVIQQAMKATPGCTGVYIHKKSFKKSQVTTLKHLLQDADISIFSSKDLLPLS